MTCLYLASASSRAALTSTATSPAGRLAPEVRRTLPGAAPAKSGAHRRSPHAPWDTVQLVDVAVDDGLLRRIRNGVAEAERRQARAHGEDEVAFVQVVCHLIAAHADEQGMILRERPFGLEGRDHRHIHELRERFQDS